MKKVIAAVLLVLLVAPLAMAGSQSEQAAPAADAGADFILINGAEPESLDPHLIQGVPENRIYQSLFDGLVIYDPETADPVPGMAESWEVSEDGTVYTFKLREAYWTDGVRVTAQQFVDSWLRILNPDTAGPYAWFPSMFIKGAAEYNAGEAGPEAVAVRALDDSTFQFETMGPMPYTLGALAHYSFGVVPTHAIAEHGDEWTLPENIVTNGPFTLKEWLPQERLVVQKNPDYWNADSVKLNTVTYLPIDDNNTGYNMFLNGEVDWMTTVPLDQIPSAKLRNDYHVSPQLSTYYYVFQTEKPFINEPLVRKALSMAIDRQQLVDVVTQAGQIPAYGIVPDMTGYEALEGSYDVAGAKALLAEAGYPNGEGLPEFTVLYNTSDAHKKIAEFIQQQWKTNLGVNATLTNQEWQTYLKSRNQGDFEIARAGWVGDYQDPNTFLDMFVTGGGMNGGKYSNPEYDRLINQAATMPGGPERMEVLRRAEQIFVQEDMGILPLYYYVSQNMVDTSKWGGWHTNVLDIHPVRAIYQK